MEKEYRTQRYRDTDYHARWPATLETCYSRMEHDEQNPKNLVQVFRGDTLLFEKFRNDYRVNNTKEGFILQFIDNPKDAATPLILFNGEHGFIDVLDTTGPKVSQYDIPDFMDKLHVCGKYVVIVGWMWHPIWYMGLVESTKLLEGDNELEHEFFSEPYADGIEQLVITDTHLVQGDVRYSWDQVMQDKLYFSFSQETGKLTRQSLNKLC